MTRPFSLVMLLGLSLPAFAAKPNVLIVLSDDQGSGDFSYAGNPILKTPNMDRLAKESVRLTDFHVAPMCSPTRGQLMTGVDALRNGVTSVTAGRTFLRPGIPTAAEIFASAGYKTGLFGKWHLGDHYPHRPIDRGFHESAYHLGWGMLHAAPEFDNPLFDGRFFHNGEPKTFTGHCTDLWFDHAEAWMKERKEKGEPFFCYIPTNAPHAPHIDKDEFIVPYRNRGKAPAGFFGMIAHVDQRLGQLDEFLTKSGLRENTIVIFATDNGGTSGVPLFNAGLRAGKTTYYDGGHRVPCFIRWPGGKLGEPRDVGTPAQVQDILPTLLEMCDVPRPAETKFDGRSLKGLLDGTGKDPAFDQRMLVVQYGQIPKKWDCCVIWNKWRLVKGEELYDTETDRGQQTNLIEKEKDVAAKIRTYYEGWWQELESKISDFVPTAHIGSPREPEVELTSADWENIYADNTGHVRNAVGGPTGGHWHLFVETPGEYEIVLRRWPRSTKAALGAKYDALEKLKEVGGKSYAPASKSFPIAAAVAEIAGQRVTAKTAPAEQEIAVKVKLPAGKTTLKAWFQDDKGQDQCGAFYAYVRKVK